MKNGRTHKPTVQSLSFLMRFGVFRDATKLHAVFSSSICSGVSGASAIFLMTLPLLVFRHPQFHNNNNNMAHISGTKESKQGANTSEHAQTQANTSEHTRTHANLVKLG